MLGHTEIIYIDRSPTYRNVRIEKKQLRLLTVMSCALLLAPICQAQTDAAPDRFPDGYFIQAKRDVSAPRVLEP